MNNVIKMRVQDVVNLGGVTPTGEIDITENGEVDVSQYASANVNVPQGVFPTGTKNITENGEVDVSQYASANVVVPTYENYTIEGLSSYVIKPTNPDTVTDSYKGTSYDDKTLANCPSLSTFYTTFYDKYINVNLTNYEVTKKSLGKDQSGTYDLYEYDFKPSKWDRMILLTSGMHGYEVSSIFGLAYLLNDIIENYANDALLTYLHNHVRIKVIPVVNPWGYSQSPKSYVQSRGVNINRNFDYNGEWEQYDPGSNPNNNKGTAPFSESETQILRQWASENYGAEFWIDCHTSVGVSNDKEIFTSTISTTPLYDEITAAHGKLETWTKSYYGLSILNVEYRIDSPGSGKQRWYQGIYGKTCLVVEQSSNCATIGNVYNGDRNSIVNYTAQIYAYIGEFLLKAAQSVTAYTYIEELQQEAIENLKYIEPLETEPTPIPLELYCYQGTLSSTTGEPSANTTRVYTAEVPITHTEFHIIGFGSGYWFGGRAYDDQGNYIQPLQSQIMAETIAFKNSSDYAPGTSWGIVSDATIVVGSAIASSVKKFRLIIRTELGSDDISPLDLEDKEISVDGVTYILKPTVVSSDLSCYQGSLSGTTGDPTVNATRVYTADIPITDSEFHVTGFGNGYWFGGRFYDTNDSFVASLVDFDDSSLPHSSLIRYKNANEHSGAWGNVSDVTVEIGSDLVSTAKKMKIIVRTELGSDNLAPSDVEDMEISVDGISYTLKADVVTP